MPATYSQMVQKKKKRKVCRQGKQKEDRGERENKFGKKC